MMDDLISKQKLIKAINTWPKFGCDERGKLVPWNENYVPYIHLTDAITAINGMPSAEPQIIYCKDCEYFKRDIPCSGGVYNGCEKWLDNGNEIEVGEYDWCSKRKRKSNG